MTCLVTQFDRQIEVFENSSNWPFLTLLVFLKNVNVARFARHVEWDFISDFQTLWLDFPVVNFVRVERQPFWTYCEKKLECGGAKWSNRKVESKKGLVVRKKGEF